MLEQAVVGVVVTVGGEESYSVVREVKVIAIGRGVVSISRPVPRAVPHPSVRPGAGLAAVALYLIGIVPSVIIDILVHDVADAVPIVVGWLGEAAPPERAAGGLLRV